MSQVVSKILKYFKSCFLLILPVMAWDFFLASKLPLPFQSEIFWNNIPFIIALGEHIFRLLIFALTLIMPLSFVTKSARVGVIVYLIGVFLYFFSWLALIYYPQTIWSNSYGGFLAPAYTPIVWLTGIALIGNKFYCNLPYKRWVFLSVTIIFLIFHNYHTLIIYNRIY